MYEINNEINFNNKTYIVFSRTILNNTFYYYLINKENTTDVIFTYEYNEELYILEDERVKSQILPYFFNELDLDQSLEELLGIED